MAKFDFNIKVFAFKDDELWNHIMFILDENIETEGDSAIGVNLTGELRVHACGRTEALKDLKRTLNEQRNTALELTKDEVIG
jgi:hypothetical protein